jgi:hypothetical protein
VHADAYQILDFDPLTRWALVAVSDLGALAPGLTLREGTAVPLTVDALEVVITPEAARVHAYAGAAARAPVADALSAIIEHIATRQLHGSYRYRVVRMSGNRVDLEAARPAAGLPDAVRVPQWTAPGYHAELVPGCEVLVSFADGDRGAPVVTHAIGADGAGHVPVSVSISGGERPTAAQGDLVMSGGPGTVCILTPVTGVGAPPNNAVVAGVPHLISFSALATDVGPLAKPLPGAIATGSQKVKTP